MSGILKFLAGRSCSRLTAFGTVIPLYKWRIRAAMEEVETTMYGPKYFLDSLPASGERGLCQNTTEPG